MAKKPFNVLSATALAAVLASSAIVPTAVFAAETTQSVQNVIVEHEGEIFELSYEDYTNAKSAGVNFGEVKYVVSSNGKQYKYSDFTQAKPVGSTVDGTLELLEKDPTNVQDVTPGKVIIGEDGKPEYVPPVVNEDFEVTDIAANNETTVTVNFPSDSAITEADLKDSEITLAGGDSTLTATYKADSLANGKASFALSGDSKLVDATTYTVTGKLLKGSTDFVAKVVGAYGKTFAKVTSDVIAKPADTKVYFSAKDQYGKDFALTGLNSDIEANVTLNGVPLLSNEYGYTIENGLGVVTVKTDLSEGNKLAVTVKNTVGDQDYSETFAYDVIKGEASVATTISNLQAKYAGTPANGHKLGEAATEVLADDTVKLTADVQDQYKNPLDGEVVRWVVESGAASIKDPSGGEITKVSDSTAFNFKAVAAGDVQISAYLANGKKVTYNVTIGAKKLENIDLVTFTGDVFNYEAKSSAKLDITAGAVLKASDLKFHVTATPEGAKAEDLTLEAVQGTGEKANEVTVKATATKTGTYKFIPYVGESFETATVKGTESTFTSKVREEVASISNFTFDAKALKAGAKNVKAEIVFKNKHGEVLNKAQADATVTSSKPGTTDVVTIEQGTGDNVAKTYVNLADLKAGTSQVTVQAGDVLKSATVTVGTSTLTTIDAGSNVTGVVAGDSATAELAKYNGLKFLDQDGINLGEQDATVTVRKAGETADLSAEDASKIVKVGTITYDTDGKVSNFDATADNKYNGFKIHPESGVAEGTYTVTVSKEVTVGETTKTVSDSFTVEVGSERALKAITAEPKTATVGLGATTKIVVTSVDQYKKFFALSNVTPVGDDIISYVDGSWKPVQTDGKTTGYEFEVKGIDNGEGTITIASGTKVQAGYVEETVKVTVAPTATIVNTVALIGEHVNEDGTAKNVLKSNDTTGFDLNAVGKDASGKTININQSEVIWSTSDKTVADVDVNGKVTTETVTEDKQVTITADVFGKKQSITFTVSAATEKLKAGTLKVANAESVDGDTTTEGIQIVLDEKAENGTITVTFTGSDQYGDVIAPKVTANSFNASVATATANNANVVITAAKEGETQVRVTVGADEVILPVKVTKEAVEQAQAATALATAKATAKSELNSYVVAEDYTTNAADLTAAIEAGKTAIDAAGTTDAVATALSEAKTAIDAIESDAKIKATTVSGVSVIDGTDGFTPVTTPTVGQVIRANINIADGSTIGTYPVNPDAKYKWFYKESPDQVLGTESSYTVTSDNVGKTISVEVSVDGYKDTATWNAIDVVASE